jgi:hypothetical protein
VNDTTAQAAVVAQLQTTGANSKKFRMVIIGIVSSMVIFFASIGSMVFKAEIAASVASLSQIIVTAIGGMVAIYAGAQAWSETSATNALGKKEG